jgi:hypothetical protein
MEKAEGAASLFKLVLTSAGTGATSSPLFNFFNAYISTPVWGVPVTVMGASAAGAALSLCFGDPVESRKALFGQVAAATAFGTAFAVLAADAMNWDWAEKNLSMFAMMSAALCRWFLPTIIERGKQLIKDFKFSLTRNNGGPQ